MQDVKRENDPVSWAAGFSIATDSRLNAINPIRTDIVPGSDILFGPYSCAASSRLLIREEKEERREKRNIREAVLSQMHQHHALRRSEPVWLAARFEKTLDSPPEPSAILRYSLQEGGGLSCVRFFRPPGRFRFIAGSKAAGQWE